MAKIDGVIEAVRYKGSRIDFVRLYERRGATFSDRILMDRQTLLVNLQKGRRFFTGRRRELLASTFEIDKSVFLSARGEELVVTTTLNGHERDRLEGVPVL